MQSHYYKERTHYGRIGCEDYIGDLYDFLLRHSYNSVSGLLGAVIGALGVIVGISRQYWIYLILGVVILLYLPWTLYIKSKQQAVNNPVFKEPLHYVLDENGITISQGTAPPVRNGRIA